jgi:hypothetical protein
LKILLQSSDLCFEVTGTHHINLTLAL